MISLTAIVSSALICALIPEVVYTSPCHPGGPPPQPSCHPPTPPQPPCHPPTPPQPSCQPPTPPSPQPSCGTSSVDIDINIYKEKFTECQYVEKSEIDVYLSWIQTFSQDEIVYVDDIMGYLTVQTALVEEITNFEVFKQTISGMYELLKSKNIYSQEIDLSSQTTVFEEIKTKIVEMSGCLSEQSKLYTILKYCETDVILMPIVIGLCNSVVISQETYASEYSSYSETTSKTETINC